MRRAPLGRTFWDVWSASTISYLGDGVFFGAVPLLAASLTRDARLISLIDALTMAGWLLLGLVSGVMVDRWRKTKVMWRVDALRAAVMVAFCLAVGTGHASIALVLAVSFALGLASPFFDNASSAVMPEIVERDALERANSWNQSSLVLCANLIGPPLGAALFVWRPVVPLGIQAASFVGAAALVARVGNAGRSPEPAEGRSLRGELFEGLRYLRNSRLLRSLGILLAVINGMTGGVVALLVLYVLQVLHLPQAAYGWLVAVFAVGGLAGAVLSPRLRTRVSTFVICMLASVLFATGALVMGLLPTLVAVVPAIVITGIGSVLWNVATISLRQRIVPAALLGRVTSVYRMVGFGATPVGAFGAGLLAHATDVRVAYVVGGAVLFLATALCAPSIRAGLVEHGEHPRVPAEAR